MLPQPTKQLTVACGSGNNSKAKTKLNWDVKYSLDDMMKTAWEWQKRLAEIHIEKETRDSSH